MSNQRSENKVLQKLALEEAVRRQMDDIVRQAAEAVKLLKPSGEKQSLQENQIRNVINVAGESESIAVVTNFIRYQIGRSSQGQGWQYNGFGLRVIEDIEAGVVAKAARDAATKAAGKIEGADEDSLYHQAYLELTRHYLGYLNRAFVFCTKTKETGHQIYRDPWAMAARLKEV